MSLFKVRADLVWAHSVNSKVLLQKALSDERVNMIVTDIIVGTLRNDFEESLQPIMDHSTNETADLSLSLFLHDVIKYNKRYFTEPKGVKLDFKSIEAFEMSLPLLKAVIPVTYFPIWLNADIIEGPVNAKKCIPVDPDRFLQACFTFKRATLCVGWTTNWSSAVQEGDYSANYVDAMIKVLQKNNIHSSGIRLTFPVRADIAVNSKDELKRLLDVIEDTNDCSLTICSSEKDYVNVDELYDLIHVIGKRNVYLDITDKLKSQLEIVQRKRSQHWTDSWPKYIIFLALATAFIAGAFYVGQKTQK